MRWSAHYSGATYTSDHISPQELPATGVQVIIEHYDDGSRKILSGGDYYWWEGTGWHYIPSGEWGTWKDPPNIACLSCVKQGVGLPDSEYREIYEDAFNFRVT